MALNHTQAVLSAFVTRLQELENAAWTLLQAMSIDGAIAAGADDLLNKIGAIVGEPRIGRSNADYGAGIKLKIRVNISTGRALDVVAVAILAYAPALPNYLEGYPAGFVVDMPNLASAQYVAQKLGRARAAGTYGLVQFTSDANPVLFLDSVTAGAVTLTPHFLDSVSGGAGATGEMSAALMV